MDQLDLFGALPAPPPAPVAAPAHPPALAALGAKLPPQVHLGCSSWTFPGWAGHVYAGRPAERALIDGGLAAYHQHPLLRGVSVDRGLYGPLAAATYAGMAAQVGAGFRFWTKIHQDVTLARFPDLAAFGAQRGALNPRWLDPAYTAEAVVGPILAGLGDRAGPILFQFTPGHASEVPAEAFAERLHGVLQALPRGPLYAVELRDSSLMTKDYADALADVGAAHCYSSHPRTLDLDFQRLRLPPVLAPALVLRWNLGGGLSRPDAIRRFAPYDRLQHPQLGTRALIARLCRQAAQRGQPVHLVVGNHAEGCAPLTLQAIAEGIVAG
ncbi:MAG: DUF72 domain-containing protein [Myxococcales bacterium]|nr:DUF72 domain-containing protein [Myxococcales bacterium]MCB9547142.1 DUF72 domain-containing protein [Myxococcales bacterium]